MSHHQTVTFKKQCKECTLRHPQSASETFIPEQTAPSCQETTDLQ